MLEFDRSVYKNNWCRLFVCTANIPVYNKHGSQQYHPLFGLLTLLHAGTRHFRWNNNKVASMSQASLMLKTRISDDPPNYIQCTSFCLKVMGGWLNKSISVCCKYKCTILLIEEARVNNTKLDFYPSISTEVHQDHHCVLHFNIVKYQKTKRNPFV